MNALTIGSLAAMALMGVLAALWLYRRGKAEGASQQSKKNKEKINEMAKKYIKRAYDGIIGSNAWGVRKPNGWHKDTAPGTGVRVEPKTEDGDRRRNEGSEMPDREG